MERDLLAGGEDFIIVNTVLQPIMRLNFTLTLEDIVNLSDSLENLIEILEVNASFLCNDEEQSFDQIVFEYKPIGIAYKGSESITYYFDDIAYDNNTNDYFISLYASSSHPTMLKNGKVVIDFNIDAFSSFQSDYAQNTTSIELDFFSYQLTASDLSESSIQWTFESFSNLIEITQEGTKLFTFALKLDDCTQNPNLSFDESLMQGLSFYSSPEFPAPVVYNPVIASDSEVAIFCCSVPVSPLIGDNGNDWSPIEIIAGDNQVLTINGSGFGEFVRHNNPGFGGTGSSVLFYNGSHIPGVTNNPSFIAASADDFISWTDTQIKVKVPGVGYESGGRGIAGTGFFRVRNKCNLETQSNSEINIPYGLINHRPNDDGKAYKVGLRNNDSTLNGDGYEFEFDPSTVPTVGNNIKELFGSALSQWCGVTNIRFKQKTEVNAIALQSELDDGHNTVIVKDIGGEEGQAGALAVRYVKMSCGLQGNTPTINAGYVTTEIDMIVDDNMILYPQPLYVQGIITHELGHAHLVGHSQCFIPPGDDSCFAPLMYPTGNYGNITEEDATAANRVFGVSEIIITQSGSCYYGDQQAVNVTPIQDGDCALQTGIVGLNLTQVNAFPNPTTTSILIQKLPNITDYLLRNVQGGTIFQGKISTDNLEINLSNYPAGIYFLILYRDSNIGFLKVVKL